MDIKNQGSPQWFTLSQIPLLAIGKRVLCRILFLTLPSMESCARRAGKKLCLSLFLLAFTQVRGWPSFAGRIPNGYNVPHPCLDLMWGPVGHTNIDLPVERNQFGTDFGMLGQKLWTEDLCRADSDGDGRTNGQELGDPDCIWKVGDEPTSTQNITHPAICEPIESDFCMERNTFLVCEYFIDGSCPVLNEADIHKVDLTIPPTAVPNVETTYICMTFDLPEDEDNHVVAFKPIIDKASVVHHMIIYGCGKDTDVHMPVPGSCEMPAQENSCYNVITLWTYGLPGRCYGEDVGFRIGKNGIRRVRLEIHWNNPYLYDGLMDSSGVRIFYRSAKSAVQDLAVFATGQTMLEIPPGQSHVNFSGGCDGPCTSAFFNKPVYVLDVINHMHYLGRSMKVEVYRHGKWLLDLSNDEVFDYDSPVFHEHSPPIQLQPGDEIRTTCVYKSTNSNRWVYYGESTSDEMCFAFLLLYPADALTYGGWCVSHGPMTPCDWAAYTWIGACNWAQFLNPTDPANVERNTELERNCNLDGFCRPECRETVDELQQHPCLQGEAGRLVRYLMTQSHEGTKYLGRLTSCSDGRHPDSTPTPPPPTSPPQDCNMECARICAEAGGALSHTEASLVTWLTMIIAAAAVAIEFF